MLLFVFQADLAEGFRAGYGCNFSTWETNGECDFAGDGLHEQPHFQNYYRVLSRRFGLAAKPVKSCYVI